MKMESELEDAKILTNTGIVFMFLNNEYSKIRIK